MSALTPKMPPASRRPPPFLRLRGVTRATRMGETGYGNGRRPGILGAPTGILVLPSRSGDGAAWGRVPQVSEK